MTLGADITWLFNFRTGKPTSRWHQVYIWKDCDSYIDQCTTKVPTREISQQGAVIYGTIIVISMSQNKRDGERLIALYNYYKHADMFIIQRKETIRFPMDTEVNINNYLLIWVKVFIFLLFSHYGRVTIHVYILRSI